jgi:hypothetical protein
MGSFQIRCAQHTSSAKTRSETYNSPMSSSPLARLPQRAAAPTCPVSSSLCYILHPSPQRRTRGHLPLHHMARGPGTVANASMQTYLSTIKQAPPRTCTPPRDLRAICTGGHKMAPNTTSATSPPPRNVSHCRFPWHIDFTMWPTQAALLFFGYLKIEERHPLLGSPLAGYILATTTRAPIKKGYVTAPAAARIAALASSAEPKTFIMKPCLTKFP